MTRFQKSLEQTLDTFFHLPTLIVLAVIALAVLWQIYGLGLNVGDGFVRLSSNRGGITVHWVNGCCDLLW